MAKYYLLTGDTSQVSTFSFHKIKLSVNNRYLFSKLSFTYRVNVNHDIVNHCHHTLSTLLVWE